MLIGKHFKIFGRNVAALGIEQELVYVANEPGKLLAIKNLFKQVDKTLRNFDSKSKKFFKVYLIKRVSSHLF